MLAITLSEVCSESLGGHAGYDAHVAARDAPVGSARGRGTTGNLADHKARQSFNAVGGIKRQCSFIQRGEQLEHLAGRVHAAFASANVLGYAVGC